MKIGIDIGGTKTEIGIVDNGNVVEILRFDTPSDEESFVREIVSNVEKISKGKEIEGVGVSVASDTHEGVVFTPPNLPLKNFDLGSALGKSLGVKVRIENDANCYALAELHYGYGRDYSNFVVVAVGTGIGGGIVIDKKLYSGKGAAGEIGHMAVSDLSQKDGLGIKGSFEAIASGKAVVKLAKKELGRKYLAYELADMAKKGNKKAVKVLDEISYRLGRGLVTISNVLNPDAIILTGGVVLDCGSMITRNAKRVLRKGALIKPKVHISRMKKGALIGAVELL